MQLKQVFFAAAASLLLVFVSATSAATEGDDTIETIIVTKDEDFRSNKCYLTRNPRTFFYEMKVESCRDELTNIVKTGPLMILDPIETRKAMGFYDGDYSNEKLWVKTILKVWSMCKPELLYFRSHYHTHFRFLNKHPPHGKVVNNKADDRKHGLGDFMSAYDVEFTVELSSLSRPITIGYANPKSICRGNIRSITRIFTSDAPILNYPEKILL